jgi:hypothetical protein
VTDTAASLKYCGVQIGGRSEEKEMQRLMSVGVAAFLVALGLVTQAGAGVPSGVSAKFTGLDKTFAAADHKWTDAIEALHSSSPASAASKPSVAFIPAIKTFDSGLVKVGFTGGAATTAASIVALNNQLIGVLGSIKSLPAFESQFGKLFPKYLPLQAALAKDLGIPAADVTI